jgi:uncharacterized protein
MNPTSPPPHGVQLHHQNELNQGRFLIQRCSACGRGVYFPREVCPHCGGRALQWETPSGLGTVHAVTTVKRKPDDGGDLNVSVVELDEGVRLMSRVESLLPGDVRIGLRVKSRVLQVDGRGIVVFDPIDGGGA